MLAQQDMRNVAGGPINPGMVQPQNPQIPMAGIGNTMQVCYILFNLERKKIEKLIKYVLI